MTRVIHIILDVAVAQVGKCACGVKLILPTGYNFRQSLGRGFCDLANFSLFAMDP